MFLPLFAAVGFAFNPFGQISEIKEPWRGFDAKGPILLVAAIDPINIGTSTCSIFLKTVQDYFSKNSLTYKNWEPWSASDLEAIGSCDSSPCKIKLSPEEIKELVSVPESRRQEKYFVLVRTRMEEYEKNETRKRYERPEAPINPWAEFETRGFKSNLSRPSQKHLFTRVINLSSEEARPIRQVLDIRSAVSGNHLSFWIRDLYTAHYFDSWGEWIDLDCDEADKTVLLAQALLVEFDLLKNTNILSRLARPRMRKAIETQGGAYLLKRSEKIKQLITSRK